METLFKSFAELGSTLNKVHPLAAIWFDHGIKTATEKTPRICAGHLIRVVKDEVVNVTEQDKATHKVLECYGNINNTILYFELENIHNGDLLTLKIK